MADFGLLRFKPCEEAESLVKGIEEHIGFDDETGLVKYVSSNRTWLTICDNAALALVYIALGRKEDSLKLVEGIEKHIGLDENTGLVTDEYFKENELPFPEGNALLAIVYNALGRKDDAVRLFDDALEALGRGDKTGLVYDSIKSPSHDSYYTSASAAFAIAYLALNNKEEAARLVEGVEEIIGFVDEKGLITDRNLEKYACRTQDNALLSIAYSALGMHDKASQLLRKIEEHINSEVFEDGSKLASDGFLVSKKPSLPDAKITRDNALLALAYMAEKAHGDGSI
jgi:tetratricopeptide (TPR) repeat protein